MSLFTLRYRFDDARRIPTSQFMEDSRRQTFTDAWPHTSKKHGANPTQVSFARSSCAVLPLNRYRWPKLGSCTRQTMRQ
jgi:hypothetical protein